MPDPKVFEVTNLWSSTLSSSAPEAKLECPVDESVIRAEELCIHIHTTVLHEPPSSTNKNVVDLIFHTACVGTSTQPGLNRSLEPGTPNPESP